jgi:hypothetical protein
MQEVPDRFWKFGPPGRNNDYFIIPAKTAMTEWPAPAYKKTAASAVLAAA